MVYRKKKTNYYLKKKEGRQVDVVLKELYQSDGEAILFGRK